MFLLGKGEQQLRQRASLPGESIGSEQTSDTAETDRLSLPGPSAVLTALDARPALKKERRSAAIDKSASADEDDEDEHVFVYGGWDSDRLADTVADKTK